MRIKTLVIFGLVLWAWSPMPVFAQGDLGSLRLIEKDDVSIFVYELSEAASACSITKGGLDAAVRLPLSRNGFRIKSNEVIAPVLTVKVIVIDEPSGCSVYSELHLIRKLNLIADKSVFHGIVWGKDELHVGGPKFGMGRRVYDGIEDFTKEWIAQWLIDNPQ